MTHSLNIAGPAGRPGVREQVAARAARKPSRIIERAIERHKGSFTLKLCKNLDGGTYWLAQFIGRGFTLGAAGVIAQQAIEKLAVAVDSPKYRVGDR